MVDIDEACYYILDWDSQEGIHHLDYGYIIYWMNFHFLIR